MQNAHRPRTYLGRASDPAPGRIWKDAASVRSCVFSGILMESVRPEPRACSLESDRSRRAPEPTVDEDRVAADWERWKLTPVHADLAERRHEAAAHAELGRRLRRAQIQRALLDRRVKVRDRPVGLDAEPSFVP